MVRIYGVGSGALSFRLQKRGVDQYQIFVERKTHHEDWTGEKYAPLPAICCRPQLFRSVKARFSLKEGQINPFIRGELPISEIIDPMIKKGRKSMKELGAIRSLATEVQQKIRQQSLVPVMRTFYNRYVYAWKLTKPAQSVPERLFKYRGMLESEYRSILISRW